LRRHPVLGREALPHLPASRRFARFMQQVGRTIADGSGATALRTLRYASDFVSGSAPGLAPTLRSSPERQGCRKGLQPAPTEEEDLKMSVVTGAMNVLADAYAGFVSPTEVAEAREQLNGGSAGRREPAPGGPAPSGAP
jgi:hypothetical protein